MIDLPAGDEIAGYRLLGRAGGGAMGEVFRALQPGLERTVALKVIRPERAGDERQRDRLRQEARLAATIEDPAVIPVYETGETDGTVFVAMRWVEGPSLRQVLDDTGALAVDRALEIALQLAGALAAAHDRGVIHRDVKPSNVLCEDDRVFLTDFGVAAALAEVPCEDTLGEGLGGTPGYLAPEVIDGTAGGAAADIYGLGCVLYEMLTGRPVHPVSGLVATLHAHRTADPVPASRHRAELPAAIDAVLARSLAKSPVDRFPTAGEFAAALRAARDGGAQVPPRVPAPAPAPAPARVRARPPRRAAAAAAALTIIAVVAGIAVAGSGGHRSPAAARAAARSCGATRQVSWTAEPVQTCPLLAPIPPKGWVPVYGRPFASTRTTTHPSPSSGWLTSLRRQSFVCQQRFPGRTYHHPNEPWFNDWWAYTLSDEDQWGWVPEVFLASGGNDRPDPRLRHCEPGDGVLRTAVAEAT